MKNTLIKITIMIIMVLTLTNCSSTVNRTHVGVFLVVNIYNEVVLHWCIRLMLAEIMRCRCICSAELLYNSDKDVHNAVFMDHLNTSGNGSSYTNWYNAKTGNSGIIHISKSYTQTLKCTDYDHTIDITNSWALIGVGGVNREVVFGTACQLLMVNGLEKRNE